ncbi:hypothetical protein SAMN05414139_10574 [Burkholderia sp. D7]|nr:hypothetical protein SAMN05414139_10574 [Burkholderia sp. D7]
MRSDKVNTDLCEVTVLRRSNCKQKCHLSGASARCFEVRSVTLLIRSTAFFRDEVLPNLPDVLDFSRFSYDVLFAEHERVIALVNFGLTGSDATIKISEHWTVEGDKATSIWVAYFEPQALLDKLGIAHGLRS